jgi:hypothetical protein
MIFDVYFMIYFIDTVIIHNIHIPRIQHMLLDNDLGKKIFQMLKEPHLSSTNQLFF